MKKSEWNYPHKFFQAMLTCMNVFLRTCFYLFLQTNNLNIFSFMTIEKQHIWCALSPTMLSREIFLEVLDILLLVNFTTSLRSLWLLPSIALTPFCNPSSDHFFISCSLPLSKTLKPLFYTLSISTATFAPCLLPHLPSPDPFSLVPPDSATLCPLTSQARPISSAPWSSDSARDRTTC